MGTKNILIIFMLFALSPFLAAQSDYIMESRVLQKLSWTGDGNARNYEAIIEDVTETAEGAYRHDERFRDFTSDSFIIVSLPPGKYRYRVIPYDFLDHPGQGSEWVYIEVRAFPSPIIDDFSPASFYLESGAAHTLTVAVQNLSPNAEIFLRRLGGEPIYPSDSQVSEGGDSVELVFDNDSFLPGDYEIVVRNLGGQEVSKAPVAFLEPDKESARSRQLFFKAGAAWMPMLPSYGEAFGASPMILPAIAARLSIMTPALSLTNGVGVEITGCWYYFDIMEEMLAGIGVEFNIVSQIKLSNLPMALNFRAGAGYTAMPDLELAPWDSINANIGVSLQWQTHKFVYAEAGIDYVHRFTEMPSGAIRPWAGAGIQF